MWMPASTSPRDRGEDFGSRAAVFVDRDGTLIEDRHYLGDPAGVALLPGAGEAVARLNEIGLPVLLVTNQSGIGRGFFSEEAFEAVQRRMLELLAKRGARIDGSYHCPHTPDREPACDCRKPKDGLFLRAAREHGVSLTDSFFMGDRPRDVLPGVRRGGVGLLLTRRGEEEEKFPVAGVTAVEGLQAAVQHVLGALRLR